MTTVSSGDVVVTFVWMQTRTRNENIVGSNMPCLAAKHLNFERALDKCSRAIWAHYRELNETGNRVFGIQVSDCLKA